MLENRPEPRNIRLEWVDAAQHAHFEGPADRTGDSHRQLMGRIKRIDAANDDVAQVVDYRRRRQIRYVQAAPALRDLEQTLIAQPQRQLLCMERQAFRAGVNEIAEPRWNGTDPEGLTDDPSDCIGPQ